MTHYIKQSQKHHLNLLQTLLAEIASTNLQSGIVSRLHNFFLSVSHSAETWPMSQANITANDWSLPTTDVYDVS